MTRSPPVPTISKIGRRRRIVGSHLRADAGADRRRPGGIWAGETPAIRLAGLRDKAGEETVDLAGFLHLRQMAGLVENVHRHLAGERLGMGERDDAVVAAPDDLH